MRQDQHTSTSPGKAPHAALFAACLLAMAALLWPELRDLVRSWNSEDYSYSYLLPFAFLYMLHATEGPDLWRRIGRGCANSASAAIFAAASVLYIAGKIGAIISFAHMAALLFLTGLFAAFYGLRFLWRNKTAFIVLFFCIPLPPFVTKLLTFRLRLFSTHLAEIMMHQVGIPVFVEGNIIDLGIAQLQVVDACSGMRYFFPIIILTLVMTFVLRTGPLAKVLLLAASPVVAVVANAFRLLVIALGVHYIDRDIVNTPFHEGSGVIVYLVAGLTLLALHRLLRLVPLPGLRAREEDEQAARAARACRARALPVATGIVLAVIGVGLCAGSKAFVQTASKVEPIPLLKPFSEFPAQIGDWKIEQRIVLTSADLASLDCDAYVDVVFSNVKTGNRFYFLMTYYGEQRLSKTAHPPTSCLLGTGWLINGRRYVDHPGVPGFTFQQVLLERENVRLISNFWFIQRGDVIASEFKHRWRMLWDGVVKRRTHGALVRVEMPLLPRQTVQQGQDLLNSFTEQLTPVLREFIPE